ncbi:uncharacterized protein LOC112158140 isoform X3 [Oryzias melastigma]|uniref:uncharacterized protein LOC112158140 isoform X3 n=1 Tax=Oryzias melastigma TaxID=30732 RepID=UPI00168CFB46|nr:uncharacterized protein LOC112158140 isoform X3 [Oryzias melastigma]
MSTQLQEIHNDNASATAALKELDVQTDSEMQTQTTKEEPKQIGGQDNRNDQKQTSQLQEERGEVTQPDSLKDPEVQTDSGIQTKTPQEEHHELLAGPDDRNIQKPTSQLQVEHGEVTHPDSSRDPEVQTDSGIQTKTPQEEHHELLAGPDNRNIQKPTSQLQVEHGEVTHPDSSRDVQTDPKIQTPQEGHHEPSAGQDDRNIQKPTSQIQDERGEVTKQDSPRASSTEDETVLTLLQEIEKQENIKEAASVLKELGIQTDSQIKSLTPEDLNELFPGLDKLKFRKIIFQIIHHKNSTDQLLEKPEGVAQRQFLMDECLEKITYLKKQLDEALTEAQVNTAENFRKRLDFKKDPHFQTDLVFQTLTREDLQKLFPGRNNFMLRKTMFEILRNLPNDLLLGESGDVTQQDAAEDDHVRIKNMKDQLDRMTAVLEKEEKGSDRSSSQRSLLNLSGSSKDLSADDRDRIKNMKDQLDRMTAVIEKGYSPDSTDPTTTHEKHNEREKGNDFLSSLRSLWFGSSQKHSVKCKMVVCGQTFGAHRQLLDQIQTPDLNLIKGKDGESCITFVFCPVVSRTGTDAEAAMKMVPGDVPVILVLMHHSQEPKHVSSSKVLTSYSNVVLEVNIFYHDRKNGLLVCEQNKNAVIELRKTLNNYRAPSPESNKKGSK